MKHEEPIKIGRIARPSERALGISLTGEVSIYMAPEDLDAIARKRPNDYLAFLEEISKIIHDPDYVAFEAEQEKLVYAKDFFKDDAFRMVFLSIKRSKSPGKWYFDALQMGPKNALGDSFQGLRFVRPQVKAIPSKN